MAYTVGDKVPTPGGIGKVTAVNGEVYTVITYIAPGAFERMPSFGKDHTRYLSESEINALKDQYRAS